MDKNFFIENDPDYTVFKDGLGTFGIWKTPEGLYYTKRVLSGGLDVNANWDLENLTLVPRWFCEWIAWV